MDATISVALATFNGGRFVAAQVESILQQDRRPDEIVVADDGSTDGTVAVVRAALAGSNMRVTILGDGNRLGVTGNFERAIAACGGDIVILSDQDDLWSPQRVSTAFEAFRSDKDLLLHHANARLVDACGRPLERDLFEALEVSMSMRRAINSGQAFECFLRRNLVTGAVLAFRRQLYDSAAPLPPEWLHDEWLAIIAAARGRVEVSELRLIDYRQHGANEVGVSIPSWRDRFNSSIKSDGGRNRTLAARSRVLERRLSQMDDVEPHIKMAAAAKARFEESRAALPPHRLARIPAIVRAARRGDYTRFASRGRWDTARDLIRRP